MQNILACVVLPAALRELLLCQLLNFSGILPIDISKNDYEMKNRENLPVLKMGYFPSFAFQKDSR